MCYFKNPVIHARRPPKWTHDSATHVVMGQIYLIYVNFPANKCFQKSDDVFLIFLIFYPLLLVHFQLRYVVENNLGKNISRKYILLSNCLASNLKNRNQKRFLTFTVSCRILRNDFKPMSFEVLFLKITERQLHVFGYF